MKPTSTERRRRSLFRIRRRFPPSILYRSRIAQYIDELSLEQQAYDALLPEEERGKIIDFIRSFLEQYSKRETKRLNRLF